MAAQVDTVPPVWSVDGETLRRAGVTRVGDVLALVGVWPVATISGSGWEAAPPGGSPFLPAGWTVLVDGRPVEAERFGSVDLDRAGLAIDRIHLVEFHEVPRLVAGRLTTEGILHLHTREPPSGVSATGGFATGSEIGDPGPFAFTPVAEDNVDRLGHDVSGDLFYGGGSWYAGGALATSVRIPTDPAIVARHVAALGSGPRLEARTLSLEGAARGRAGDHRLTLRHARLDGALGLDRFGRETGVRERVTQLGLAGTIPGLPGRTLSYDLSHTADRVRPRHADSAPALDRDARVTEGRLELAGPHAWLSTAGLRVRRGTVTLATAYAEAALGRRPVPHAVVSGLVTAGDGAVGIAGFVSRRWTLGTGSTLEGLLGYERANGDEADRSAGRHERLAGDLVWSAWPWRGLRVVARGTLRRERDLTLERRRWRYVPATESFEGPATVVPGAGGEQAGARVEAELRRIPRTRVRLAYWYAAAVGGDSLYRESRATVPRHGARLVAEYEPVRGLDLWLSAAYRSSARWDAFEEVEAASAGRYAPALPSLVTVDLAIAKALWNGRLYAQAAVRNLLGADLRYHPAGAAFAPTALVRVGGRLP